MTGEDYSFTMALEPGNYRLMAVAPSVAGEVWGPADITVTDRNLEGVVVEKLPPVLVKGRVVGEGDGLRLSTLQVRLQPDTPSALNQGSTANVREDGTFQVEKLFPGKYTITASSIGQQIDTGYTKSVRVGEQESIDRKIEIMAGSAPPVEIVVSTKGAVVNGNVTYEQGKPLGRAVAVLFYADKRLREHDYGWRVASSSSTGTLSFANVAPGKYKAIAWEEMDMGEWRDPEVLARYESQAVDVDVTEGDQKTIALKAVLSSRISASQREEERRRDEEALKGSGR